MRDLSTFPPSFLLRRLVLRSLSKRLQLTRTNACKKKMTTLESFQSYDISLTLVTLLCPLIGCIVWLLWLISLLWCISVLLWMNEM